jgi:hypothetical protein
MGHRRIVKRAFASLLLLVTLAGAGCEVLWRASHPASSTPLPSPGWVSVEQRHLGEGEVLPYGQGVFLFPSLVPVRSMAAKLVFAGYCGNISFQWASSSHLHISCELAEGEPAVLVPKHFGVVVSLIVVSRRGS